jgi:hypothetical protein
MARPKEAITEAKLARIMVSLYPVRGWRRKTPAFRFGFVPIPGTPLGCCLDDRWPKRPLRGLVKEYAKANGRPFERVYGEILEGRSSVLLVDPAVYELGKWPIFLLVAIHEYAHFLRGTMRAIYRTDYSAKNFEEVIGEQFDFDDRVRGRRTYRRDGPLFDGWCYREGDADPPIAHDPLFYFILYFLERTAVEKGYFGMRAEPVSGHSL